MDSAHQLSPETPRPRHEERANAATHFLGFVGAVTVTLFTLPWTRQLPITIAVAFYIYLATLVAMYFVSALSHAVDEPRAKHALRALDQGVIYLLIAGTYTPFLTAYIPKTLGHYGLTALWVAAGILFFRKVVLRSEVINFSARSYLAMGWIPAIVYGRFVPMPCLMGLLIGGILYSFGVYFLLNDRRAPYYHVIWHVFVIAASAAHFYVIWEYVLR